jgi:predicted NUDIX family phosphoesterase/thymidylate kinase
VWGWSSEREEPLAKSDRQIRAEELAERFPHDARRPAVIEFAGVPKAGKTSTIAQLQTFLKRCGFRVKVVVERASICPIRDKRHSNFNVWTATTTLAQILEHTQDPPRPDDPDVLILDRGLFDSICWLRMMDNLSRLRALDREAIEQFLLCDDWRKRITGVVVMTVSPKDALSREQGLLPVESAGSIMNKEVLQKMLETTRETMQELKDKFPIYEVDTSKIDSPQRTAEDVADHVLSLIESQLREEILSLPSADVEAVMSGRELVREAEARRLMDLFGEKGGYSPRNEVEEDEGRIQALPVVVVRNRSGQVLRIRRKEKRSTSALHKKIVVWAGGHVRREDGMNGVAIVRGALRELAEELRLNVEPEELHLLGAIHLASTPNLNLRKHIAIVFEWRAETDDVAVVLSTSEFFERRGTSQIGWFVSVPEAMHEAKEDWSLRILDLLMEKSQGTKSSLF